MGLADGAHRLLARRLGAEGLILAIQIREERDGDQRAIRELLAAAFPGLQEADLVDALRIGGDLAISLVAEEHGTVKGYVGFPQLMSPTRALALAPVGVGPECQNRGIGSLLVREGLESARLNGWEIIFVVGEPGYYARFGFDLDAAKLFPCAYAGPYFMALRLTDAIREPAPVIYPAAFDDLR